MDYTCQISKYQVSIADWSTFYNDGSSGKQGTFNAAYYDGVTAKYTLYAHGSDETPPKSADGSTGWNYANALSPTQPWAVGMGTEGQNGTFNMMGNVWDWMEDSGGVLRGLVVTGYRRLRKSCGL